VAAEVQQVKGAILAQGVQHVGRGGHNQAQLGRPLQAGQLRADFFNLVLKPQWVNRPPPGPNERLRKEG
jgi:hypothetical protein